MKKTIEQEIKEVAIDGKITVEWAELFVSLARNEGAYDALLNMQKSHEASRKDLGL